MVLFLSMTRYFPLESSVAVITGTHSAGKSTLLNNFEMGKVSTLGIEGKDYDDDLGYGIVDSPIGPRALITIPESARMLADACGRPDLLAENYTLDFQLSIDAVLQFRIHEATAITSQVSERLVKEGLLPQSDGADHPIVLSDRGPLDGVIYSEARSEGRDTNIINGFGRTGFHTEWMKSFVDLVIVADHTTVPFQADATRLADVDFRDRIADSVLLNYSALMPADSVRVVTGDKETRRSEVEALLAPLSIKNRLGRTSLSYDEWPSVRIV